MRKLKPLQCPRCLNIALIRHEHFIGCPFCKLKFKQIQKETVESEDVITVKK